MKPLLIILVVVIIIIAVGFLIPDSWYQGKLQIISLALGLGTLLGLFYYAFLTKKIAKSTEENTEITKITLANFIPVFSLEKDNVQSYGGKFIETETNCYFLFVFYIHNAKLLPGIIKFDFAFLYEDENGELIDTGEQVFAQDIFYPGELPDEKRYFEIQPGEITPVNVFINRTNLGGWIDKAYPGLMANNPPARINVKHKIGRIVEKTRGPQGINAPSRLFIRMKLIAKPKVFTKLDLIYELNKLFYLKFNGTHYSDWMIYACPEKEV